MKFERSFESVLALLYCNRQSERCFGARVSWPTLCCGAHGEFTC